MLGTLQPPKLFLATLNLCIILSNIGVINKQNLLLILSAGQARWELEKWHLIQTKYEIPLKCLPQGGYLQYT